MKHRNMSWLMIAGCVAMLAGVFLLPRAGIRVGPVLSTLLVLACPLSHVLMMAFMGGGHRHDSHDREAGEVKHEEVKQIEYQQKMLLPAPRERV